MNRWKIAFWTCLALFLLVTGISAYCILDQAVTLTYMKEGCTDTEEDLNHLLRIISETDLSKSQVERTLKNNKLYQDVQVNNDSIFLQRVVLIFRHGKLTRVVRQW